MESQAEEAAIWARTLLVEAIAALEIVAERYSNEPELTKIRLKTLRPLVGAVNAEDFVKQAKAFRKNLIPVNLKEESPYLSHMLKDSLKRIASEKNDGFDDAYVASSLLEIEKYPITSKEIELAKESLLSQESFSHVLWEHYVDYEPKSDFEESAGIKLAKLENQIKTLNIRLRTLSMFCLITGLVVSYKITNPDGEEHEILIGDEGQRY